MADPLRKIKLNPYFAIILASTIGGSSGIFIKLLDLPSTTMTFFRMFVPAAVLLVYLTMKKTRLFRGNYKMMLVASALNAARMLLFFVGYLYTSIGNAVIILFTWPVFAAIFSNIFLKERVSLRTASLIGLAFSGIVIMYLHSEISFSNRDFIGMASMLLSAMIFAMTAVIFKKGLNHYSRTETIFYQNLIGAILFMPFIFINSPLPNTLQMGVASLYGFLIGIVAFLLFFLALRKLKMSHYSLFTYWEVIAAIAFGALFFGETITFNMVIGGSLILASGILLRKERAKS